MATRGGVDTPHSDTSNGSDDNGVAGVLPVLVEAGGGHAWWADGGVVFFGWWWLSQGGE